MLENVTSLLFPELHGVGCSKHQDGVVRDQVQSHKARLVEVDQSAGR